MKPNLILYVQHNGIWVVIDNKLQFDNYIKVKINKSKDHSSCNATPETSYKSPWHAQSLFEIEVNIKMRPNNLWTEYFLIWSEIDINKAASDRLRGAQLACSKTFSGEDPQNVYWLRSPPFNHIKLLHVMCHSKIILHICQRPTTMT